MASDPAIPLDISLDSSPSDQIPVSMDTSVPTCTPHSPTVSNSGISTVSDNTTVFTATTTPLVSTTICSGKNAVSSPSSIMTLKPYEVPSVNFNSTSRRPPRSTATRLHINPSLRQQVNGSSWTKFFNTDPSSPLADDDLQFHIRLLTDVGKGVTFSTRPSGSRLITVCDEKQSEAMQRLFADDGKPIPVTRDAALNSTIGTILVPSSLRLGKNAWSDCASPLLNILTLEGYDVISVDCFVLPPTLTR